MPLFRRFATVAPQQGAAGSRGVATVSPLRLNQTGQGAMSVRPVGVDRQTRRRTAAGVGSNTREPFLIGFIVLGIGALILRANPSAARQRALEKHRAEQSKP